MADETNGTNEANESSEKTITDWIQHFSDALIGDDIRLVVDLFHDDCYWRDLVSLTWNIVTLEGKPAIRQMLETTHSSKDTCSSDWKLESMYHSSSETVEAWVKFNTSYIRGLAHVRLTKNEKDEMLCLTMLTTAQEIIGHEEPHGLTRPLGTDHEVYKGRESWIEKRLEEIQQNRQQPYVVIIGGGQAGITLGSRLSRLNVPYVILERNVRAGDSWRKRYNSLCLHDPVWYDHLPYLPFPDHWPVYAPKDRIADWLEAYVKIMDLNYWANVNCLNAEFDEDTKKWNVLIEDMSNENKQHTIPNVGHVVFATGVSGFPNVPDIEGRDKFKGKSWHSSQHPGGSEWKDKNVVVVGSNNSAHDISSDLWESGANVTMIQRSTTMVAKVESMTDMALGGLYSEAAVKRGDVADVSDLIFASIPYKILPQGQKQLYEKMRVKDGEFYKQLECAGFMLDFGVDDTGLFMKYLRRGSGYYIDTGASQLIIDGKIKLVHGELKHLNENGIVLQNNQSLDADLIVFATGYGPMNQLASKIVGKDIAKKVGRCWGLGSNTPKDPGPWEGELRNMYKPTRQEGMWYFGGNLHQCRHYSLCLALQLKARHVGIPTPVYNLATVYHMW